MFRARQAAISSAPIQGCHYFIVYVFEDQLSHVAK
jgi:hypothetical protein